MAKEKLKSVRRVSRVEGNAYVLLTGETRVCFYQRRMEQFSRADCNKLSTPCMSQTSSSLLASSSYHPHIGHAAGLRWNVSEGWDPFILHPEGSPADPASCAWQCGAHVAEEKEKESSYLEFLGSGKHFLKEVTSRQ